MSSISSTPLTSRKHRRSVKSDNAIIEMMDSVIKARSKSDERMLELEEKRLRMEERQLERETQQRRKHREFQLQMMRIMMGHRMHSSFHLPNNQHNLGQSSYPHHLQWVVFTMLNPDHLKMINNFIKKQTVP